MTSPSTPFLTEYDAPGLEKALQQRKPINEGKEFITKKRVRMELFTKSILYFLVASCLASLGIILGRTVFQPHFDPSPRPEGPPSRQVADVYRPATLEPGFNICDCGNTIQEALDRDCVYDSMATAWLPPYCRDDELTAEFDRAGPGEHGEWAYFADEQGRVPLTKADLGLLGDTGGKFWVSRDWHIAHCLFYWQKYHRMRQTGAVMEDRYDRISHIKHCTRLAMNPVPNHSFLIEVPVTMNSSISAGKLMTGH